ncbi:MAG: Lrp/AsnC family leucine-responsive transcriptional regulator [Candidatus Promineifilaceae bacterium]|jgi:Lrp/AsnC family leucine-responsive transcriptional regulator
MLHLDNSYMTNCYNNLDAIDSAILQTLQQDASLTNVKLAAKVGLSPAATLSRVRRLEQDGIIESYSIRLNQEKIGFGLLFFVRVQLTNHDVALVHQFREAIQDMAEVIECHFVTGDHDYLLKVAVKNRQTLEDFLVNKLTPVPGLARMQTTLVLNEVKTGTVLPVDP